MSGNVKQVKFSDAALSVMSACAILFIHTPLAFYAHNSTEYLFRLGNVLPSLLILWCCFSVAGFISLWMLKKSRFLILWIMTCASLIMWLQANILQWNYGIISDGGLEGKDYFGIADVAVSILVVFFLLRLSQENIVKLNYYLAVFVGCMLIWTLVTANQVSSKKKIEYVVDSYPKFDFSKSKNLILLLLDETQANIFEKLVLGDPKFAPHFDDFTFFRNATSNTKSTGHSVPMILTGSYYDNSVPYSKVINRYATSSIPLDMVKLGYESDMYYLEEANSTSFYDPVFASNSRSNSFNTFKYTAQLIDASFFMVSNHFLKRIIFNKGDWWLSSKEDFIADLDNRFFGIKKETYKLSPVPPQVPGVGDQDTRFMDDLEINGRVSSVVPKFKFYHLYGNHTPYRFDESGHHIKAELKNYNMQVTYKTKLLIRFLEKLKQLDIYDQAIIVILSDHGSGRHENTRTFINPKSHEEIKLDYSAARASTLLMVKNGMERATKITDKPVQLKQLRDIVGHLVSGQSLVTFIDQLPDRSVRRFFSYGWKDFHPYIKEYKESIIVKPVWEPDAFIYYHKHDAAHEIGTCLFDRAQIDSKDSYLGQQPFRLIAPNKITFKLPSEESTDKGTGYIVLGKMDTNKFTHGPVNMNLLQRNKVVKKLQISPDRPYFEFDIKSATSDLSVPFTIKSEAASEINKLHVFAAQFVE